MESVQWDTNSEFLRGLNLMLTPVFGSIVDPWPQWWRPVSDWQMACPTSLKYVMGRRGLHFMGEQEVTSSLWRGVMKWLMGAVSDSSNNLTGKLVQHRGMAVVGLTNSFLHERIAPVSPLESARSPGLSFVWKKVVTAVLSKSLSDSSICCF